jgi:hypothetical protein
MAPRIKTCGPAYAVVLPNKDAINKISFAVADATLCGDVSHPAYWLDTSCPGSFPIHRHARMFKLKLTELWTPSAYLPGVLFEGPRAVPRRVVLDDHRDVAGAVLGLNASPLPASGLPTTISNYPALWTPSCPLEILGIVTAVK